MADQGTRFWVQRYLHEGWSPIPIAKGEKGPRGGHMATWETDSYTTADFADDDNVGVHLGRHVDGHAGLYDVDLDDKTAAIAADVLLAPTNRIHGRPGKPRSHRFYTCDELLTHTSYHGLGGNNDTIVELRGLSPTSGKCTLTVVPPSVHPSGEALAWVADGKPAHLPTGSELALGVRDVAIAVLIARGFPGAGHRHGPRLALAGFLYRATRDKLRVLAIGRAIMRIVGGDEPDWLDTARTTIAKLEADPEANVTGGTSLKEDLLEGEQVLKRVNVWLGRQEQAFVDDVIERFNKRYFIVTAGVTPCVADDADPAGIKLFTFDAFRKVHVKARMPTRRAKDKVDKKTGAVIPGRDREGPFCADVWLEHKDGRQYDQLVYAPPPLTCSPRDYNGWKGFAVTPEPRPFPLIEAHVRDVFCGGDDRVYAWLMNWCAALVQRPGQHAVTGVVAQGGQGVGKGLVCHDLLGKLFDLRHYICMSASEQFYGRFAGELLSGRCLVFLDEATWGGDKRDMGTLKDRVTGDYLLVDRKNIAQVMERSMLHLLVASNEDWPIGVDADDRRFTVLRVTNPRANDPAYFGPIYRELEQGGRAGFLHALLHLAIDEDALRRPLNTAARTALKKRSMSSDAEWWYEKLVEGRVLSTDTRWVSHVVRSALYQDYLQFMQNIGQHRKLAPNALGGRLKRFCPSLATERANGKRTYALPALARARRDFELFLESTVAWDIEEQPSIPEPPDDVPF